MANEIETYKANSLALCEKLLCEFDKNQEDAIAFFGEEIYNVYISSIDKAKNKTKNIRAKIRNI